MRSAIKQRGAVPAMFWYFGSKMRIAHLYPMPLHRRIIEPFAGSGSYSLTHLSHDVLLIDKDETIVSIWQYLIAARPSEILALPLLRYGDVVDEYPICQEAKAFLKWWATRGSSPGERVSRWGSKGWTDRRRRQVATLVTKIRHWKVMHGDYFDAPDDEATWFIDPPYMKEGVCYKHSSLAIDFDSLGVWCKSRKGQVIVCENVGAEWLPFSPFCETVGMHHSSVEALWYRARNGDATKA